MPFINYYIVLEKVKAIPSNKLQVSVSSEVIEQVADETQISGQNGRGMDKEENIFHKMSDEEFIKNISSYTTINQEDNDKVIATTNLTPLSWVCNELKRMVHPTTNF